MNYMIEPRLDCTHTCIVYIVQLKANLGHGLCQF